MIVIQNCYQPYVAGKNYLNPVFKKCRYKVHFNNKIDIGKARNYLFICSMYLHQCET